MELFIETLTGTAFELRVSPFETIMSVKAKIQRLEGIPISQQHLIWQSMELEDDYCLHDYSIHDGATLKLVLAMRGGPINTRRIPMEDPALREMAEYVEANRDEIWEKLPGNRQVTLLVFREGDQLNFFRVVDRGDGTLTPLSESLSGASMYNLNDEDDDDDIPTKEKVEENEKLKDRMKQLRTKMEKLNLNKKQPRRKPRPPSSGRGSSRLRLRQLASTGRSASGKALNKNSCLPPVGHKYVTQMSREALSLKEDSLISKNCDKSPDITPECLPSSAALQMASTSTYRNSAKMSSVNEIKMSKYVDSLPLKDRLTDVNGKDPTTSDSSGSVHESSVISPSKVDEIQPESGSPKHVEIKNSDKAIVKCSGNHNSTSALSVSNKFDLNELKTKDKDSLLPPSSRFRTKKKGELTFEELKEVLGRPPASTKKEFSLDTFKDGFSRPPTTSRFTGLDRRKEFTLETLSTTEAQAMSGLLRQASIEKLGTSRIGSFVTSASKSRLGNYPANLTDGRIQTPDGRLLSARLQRVSNSRDGRILSPSHRLPPMKSKKKTSKRCFACAKKTGLATSYQCRCGNNFCAAHRYAESHDCTFDYKTEGRKLIAQSNPVVSAPKLPKI